MSLAKPGVSLVEHTERVLDYAHSYLDQNKIALKNTNLDPKQISEAILTACAFHDIGKGCLEFSFDKKGFSHSLASAQIAMASLNESPIKNYILQSILGHHGSRFKDSFSSLGFQRQQATPNPELVNEFKEIKDYVKGHFSIELPDLNLQIPSPRELLKRLCNFFFGAPRDRRLYFLIQGILNLADWSASAKKPLSSASIKLDSRPLRTFQAEASTGKDTIILAPTGRGKSLAALVWTKSTGREKSTLFLPTVTTVEAMYKRYTEEVSDKTGLVHGNIAYYLYSNEGYSEDTRDRIFWMKAFDNPFNVATLDQLLLMSLNWGRWEPKIVNIVNSAVIFDEIHASQPYTFGILLESIKMLKAMGTPVCVMSATLPSYMIQKLKEVLDDPVIVRDYEGESLRRITISHLEEVDPVEETKRQYEKGKRAILCFNTVRKATEAFKTLSDKMPDKDIVLYHGRFNLEDRERILSRITGDSPPRIIVATQTIEISLNISYDVLITEAAPIDSLTQRFGRVNREGTTPIGEVIIFPQNENSYSIYNKNLVDKSLGLLKARQTPSGLELREMMENLLSEIENIEEEISAGKASWQFVREMNFQIYSMSIDQRLADDLIRRIPYKTIEVIPSEFRANNSGKMQKLGKLVKVPVKDVIGRLEKDDDGFIYAPIIYDPSFGYLGPKEDEGSIIEGF